MRNNLLDRLAKYSEWISEEKNVSWHFIAYSFYTSSGKAGIIPNLHSLGSKDQNFTSLSFEFQIHISAFTIPH